MLRKLLQALLAFLIIAAGVGVAILLKMTRKAPARMEKEVIPPLVRVQTVRQQDVQMVVEGYGSVQAKVEAEVVPQVPGKVVAINANLRNGGFVKAGEVLITIDPCDYELGVQAAKADVASAEVALEIERAEAGVSREDWELLYPGKEPPSPLIFRKPQIRQAETRLKAAEAALATARLNLERTRVSLPFDGRVVRETVDLGQYVNIGQSVAKIYGIDAVEIVVPLEDWELAWFHTPGNPVSINGSSSRKTGSSVEVHADFAGAKHTWDGYVVRTTGEIDKTSRLVSVVVEVPEPFREANGRPPLVPGMFVEVLVKGKTLKDAIAVPRDAIREGNSVWVVEEGKLHIKPLQVARADRDFIYATSGLNDGALIVLSSLDTVTDGMKVRTPVDEGREAAQSSQDSNEPGSKGAE